MISISAIFLLAGLAMMTETILEIGSELTAATLADESLGARPDPTVSPPTIIVDLAPQSSIRWLD
ncbi:MAG: hypothetical protein QF595_09835 [Dehalococcoidia bacterium]|jgi:hypothetical protein|nr:hypothetical protein [Nitrospinota bacterium]MBP10041.1 hypothetical protein [Acidiferrobacteraceae bacterium]MDP6961794.1 hypothetical protein [Dehalococcoidia bacterium]